MTNQTKKYLGTILFLGVPIFAVSTLFSTLHLIIPTTAMLDGNPLMPYIFAVTGMADGIIKAWLCYLMYKVTSLYYEGGDSFKPWILRLRTGVYAYCIVYTISHILGIAAFWSHPFSGTYFHIMANVFSTFHFLPVVIGVLFVIDIMTETLMLRDETAHTV